MGAEPTASAGHPAGIARPTVVERRLMSRAFSLALEGPGDTGAAAALASLAAGDVGALERVVRRLRAAADPPGQLSAGVLAELTAALHAVAAARAEQDGKR